MPLLHHPRREGAIRALFAAFAFGGTALAVLLFFACRAGYNNESCRNKACIQSLRLGLFPSRFHGKSHSVCFRAWAERIAV